mmetsp:Transcript_8338/g.34332  ORF Transcript_8338/g.34332 Transcript_8338/m.34332 type:complete len:356 (-) Transcript_8338:1034-2101(-)
MRSAAAARASVGVAVVAVSLLTAGPSVAFVAPHPRSARCPPRAAGDPDASVITVALTREAGKNDALRSRLVEAIGADGVAVVEVPCVAQVRDADGERALDAALRDHSWAWIVVTSPEAAKILGDAIARTTPTTESRPLQIATVGGATAAALGPGLVSAFSPSKSTAATLAAELPFGTAEDAPEEDSSRKVLFPTSKLAAATLEDGLRARGFAVSRVEPYTTLPAEWSDADAATARAADVVAFGSPSAVDVWADRLLVSERGTSPLSTTGSPPRVVRACCIGKTTGVACERRGFDPPATWPEKPGLAGWADEILRAVSDLRRARGIPPTTMGVDDEVVVGEASEGEAAAPVSPSMR